MIQSLLLSSFLSQLQPEVKAQHQNYRILLIGASSYPDFPGNDLSAANDVERLSIFFQNRFEVPPSSIRVINKTEDLSREKILAAVEDWLIKPAKRGDVLLFWWGGHGMAIPTDQVGESIGAIVPPRVKRLSDGRVDSRSLILTRELRALFAKVPEGVADVTWFLDSCYSGSADRSGPMSRALVARVTNASPERMALADDSDPKGWVYVSAGSKDQPVLEVNDAGVATGPLAYSLMNLGPRLTNGITYKQLMPLLSGVAMQTRSNRDPEVSGATDRPLFGGKYQDQRWRFPLFFPKIEGVRTDGTFNQDAYYRALTAVPTRIQYDPKLPFIPVGQIGGIRPGMRFEAKGSDGFKGEFEATLCLADFTQLSPVGDTKHPTSDTIVSVRLIDSVGASKVTISVEDDNSAELLKWSEATKEIENPLIDLLASDLESDVRFKVDPVTGHLTVFTATGSVLLDKPLKDVEMSTRQLIETAAQGELVRNMQLVGDPVYEVEAKFVPVVTNFEPVFNSAGRDLTSGLKATLVRMDEAMHNNVVAGSTFAIAVRVRVNPAIADLDPYSLPGKFFLNNAPAFLSVLEVTPSNAVKSSFPARPIVKPNEIWSPQQILLRGDKWTEWIYLGLRGVPLLESEAVKSPESIKVYYPDPPIGQSAVSTFKIMVTQHRFDFANLTQNGVRSNIEKKCAPDDLVNAFFAGGGFTRDRGPTSRIQNWGLTTLFYRVKK